jgi:hypothetical protein
MGVAGCISNVLQVCGSSGGGTVGTRTGTGPATHFPGAAAALMVTPPQPWTPERIADDTPVVVSVNGSPLGPYLFRTNPSAATGQFQVPPAGTVFTVHQVDSLGADHPELAALGGTTVTLSWAPA